ncbi:MAG TPA: amino acid transporter [Stenomitos sp.]
MAKPQAPAMPRSALLQWLFHEEHHAQNQPHPQHPWWQVMCLTGVDYFSTLGYQPGIAALAAGALSPFATLILVLLTLFGALPIYRRVAIESPHGEGSIAMLERLLSWWQGKLLVLCLLGFVATDFIITITLSAADAATHVVENPLAPSWLHTQQLSITLLSVALLGGVFLKGFREAIGIAVGLVSVYLLLNAVVIGVGLHQVLTHPQLIGDWQSSLFSQHGNPLAMVAIAALLFPKLALGLSGFETGVAVMPLVQGRPAEAPERLKGRILNTHRLLLVAALIMSVFLLTSSLTTTLLIEPKQFQPGGEASGRALSYLAHTYIGSAFGTVYDLSTICILWFAGASAMAGLLNIVPRYLPRYGMAPTWARMTRPLVLVYSAIAFGVTILFNANVEAQGGAYATGVLVLMSSAAFAVALSARHHRSRLRFAGFVLVTMVFLYTTIVNIIERPDGIRIAAFFIASVIVVSLVSRISRSTELRTERVEFDTVAQRHIEELSGTIRIIANDLDAGDAEEYFLKEQEVREDNHIPSADPVLFLEIEISDASQFADVIKVQGLEVEGYKILRTYSPAVPNAIASILLSLRDQDGKVPHVYFSWGEDNPVKFLLRFIIFGEGDIPILTREILRKAEKDIEKRPRIHVGG